MADGRKVFVLYDGRARFQDTDDCAVFDTAENEEQARELGETLWYGYDAVWYEYTEKGHLLEDEKERPDLPPNRKGT